MQRFLITLVLVCFAAGAAMAQPPAKKPAPPVSEADTVFVDVSKAAGKNQIQLDVSLVNADTVAGMVIPLEAAAPGVTWKYDSVSFAGGRVEYFQLKTDSQPDSTRAAVLVGLIADMSGSNPPLPPGRGPVVTIFFTADQAVPIENVKVQKTKLPPANVLDYTTPAPRLQSVRPTLVVQTKKGKDSMGKGSMGKGSMGK